MNLTKKTNFIRLTSFLIIFSFVLSFVNPCFAAKKPDNLDKVRIKFSQKADIALAKAANLLDKAILKLANKINASKPLNLLVDSHFYDQKIRRYFISFRGSGAFTGKLPIKLTSNQYLMTSDGPLAYDLTVAKIQKKGKAILFTFSGCLVISLDQIVYMIARSIPNAAATAAISPAADLLGQFMAKLNVKLLGAAVTKTVTDFSSVAVSKAGAEVVKSASKNKNVTKLAQKCIKDGSMLSFLAIAILRSASTSIVSLAGASLGSTVGSIVAPGPGSVIGAYLGSTILTSIARTLVYTVTVKAPIFYSLGKIVKYHRILLKNPKDAIAISKYKNHNAKIIKKIKKEFDKDDFKLFDMAIKKIGKYSYEERFAFVSLLDEIKSILSFKIMNDQDWYYAKKYYQLKAKVEKWGMENKVRFTVEPKKK